MKIIKQSKRWYETYHSLFFQRIGRPHGTGIGADCNEHGMILAHNHWTEKLRNRDADRNYRLAWTSGKYHPPVLRFIQVKHVEHAVGICDVCGEEVVLDDPFLSPCGNCGTEYNGMGQRLAPRNQWGEETGEHPADIITGYYNQPDEW